MDMNCTKQLYLALLTLAAMSLPATINAQTVLTLDGCRALALENNNEIRSASSAQTAARYNHKAATTNFLPKVSASAAYVLTDRELSLLSDEQKNSLNHLGDAVSSMAPGMAALGQQLNAIGGQLVDALHTDTRNATTLAIMLRQPIYMGGKIRAFERITHYAEQIAGNTVDQRRQETIVAVDEAFWRIVDLQARRELAESYMKLVSKLDDDVCQMVDEGVATKADRLSVKVKVNEARLALIQIDNGLSLLKMDLCRICGIEMDSDIRLAHADLPDSDVEVPTPEAMMRKLDRPELRSLETAVKISDAKVAVARSAFMPTVALTGGCVFTNPSVYNSFERKFKGLWNVGIAVSMPVLTWGERSYKVKAAKAEAAMSRYELAETEEKVELQVNQCCRKLQEACERMAVAGKSREEADENLRHAEFGMKEGVVPVSNLLEAQTAWLAAHSESVSASIDMQLAEVYLNKAIGKTGK